MQQAGAKISIGGQAQAVAVLAKMILNGEIKPNSPSPARTRMNSWAGPSSGLPGAGANPKGASAFFNLRDRKIRLLGRGKSRSPGLLIIDRHQLDKAHIPLMLQTQAGQVLNLILIHSVQGNHINFDRRQPGFFRGTRPRQRLQTTHPG